MTKKTKRHIIASVGTALFMLLLLLILWLARMVTIVPEQEEGIEVAFGDVENAGGFMACTSMVRASISHNSARLRDSSG